MLVDAQRRRKRRGSHQWICHDDHTACITTDATERPASRYASESLPAEPRRLDALARHFRMSCARYHCYSQRRQGGRFVRRRQWQRRCTSRDIILRSPGACTAHPRTAGVAVVCARTRLPACRAPEPASTPRHARSEDVKGAALHPATRREQTRTRARQRLGPTPRMPPGSITPAAQSFIRNASSEVGPCFALPHLCLYVG